MSEEPADEVTLPDSKWDPNLVVFDLDAWQADLLADMAHHQVASSVLGSDDEDEEDPEATKWDPTHHHIDYGHGHAPSDYGRSEEHDTTPVPPSKFFIFCRHLLMLSLGDSEPEQPSLPSKSSKTKKRGHSPDPSVCIVYGSVHC
jgi:hypothetical protein